MQRADERVKGAYELDVGLLDDADLLRVDGECHGEATRCLLRAGRHKLQRVVEGVTPISPRRRGGAQLLGLRRPLRCSSSNPPRQTTAWQQWHDRPLLSSPASAALRRPPWPSVPHQARRSTARTHGRGAPWLFAATVNGRENGHSPNQPVLHSPRAREGGSQS